MYGQGISKDGEILDLAVKMEIIRKSGAWFYYGEERLGQGRDNVKEYIRSTPEFAADIEAQVREKLKEIMSAKNPVARAAAPAPASEPVTKDKARAKIDIAVDD
jgi:recombination protein RecA